MAVMAARLARSEPSVASRMRVGKVLNPFPFVAYMLSEGYLEPPPNARSLRCSAVHLAPRTRVWVGLAGGAGEAGAYRKPIRLPSMLLAARLFKETLHRFVA